MNTRRFDALARSFGAPRSRRGFLGALAAIAAGLGTRVAAGAQVTQVYCGNQFCASSPGSCKAGCVCCVYTNSAGQVTNSRCRPPGTCSPGTTICPRGHVVGPSGDCVIPTITTAPPPPTTTTSEPTTTTTTTTAPTTTSTTLAPTTTTTTAPPTTTSTTTAAPPTTTTTTAPPTTTTSTTTTTTTSTTTTTPAPTTTTTTTAGPFSCGGVVCLPSQNLCLANESCAEICEAAASCPSGCGCGLPSAEGPSYCIAQGTFPFCDVTNACTSTDQCPQGMVCQTVFCFDETLLRCVNLCPTE